MTVIHIGLFLCGISERNGKESPHRKKQFLVTSIKEVYSNFIGDDLKRTYSRFRPKLEEAVAPQRNFTPLCISFRTLSFFSVFLHYICSLCT